MVSALAVRRDAILALLFSLAACAPAATAPPPPPPPPAIPAPAPPPQPAGIQDEPPSAARIAADVAYLASPELAGRGTGEPGAELAAQFIAKRFTELSLVPNGFVDEHAPASFLQPFKAKVGATAKVVGSKVVQGKHTKELAAQIADGSASGTAEGEAVFVGYGITASAVGWDDYAGHDVAGKIAIVLDGTPVVDAGSPKEGRDRRLVDFGSARYKLRTAREHKAAGVVIVTRGKLPEAPNDASSMGVPAVVTTAVDAAAAFPAAKIGDIHAWSPDKAGKPRPLGAHASIETEIKPIEAVAWNVAGLLPARTGSPHTDEIVVVGAHYDHLGHGGTSASRAPGVRAIHPGADDNASGTALLLEVARRLATLPERPIRSVQFIAFGAEEIGVIGSRYWVEHTRMPIDHVVAMINADMVGRLRDERLIVEGLGTSPGWKPLLDAAAEGLGFSLAFGAEGFGASDHSSFTAARVPVAFFFTGVHPDYHMPSDTADKINAAGEERVATLAARLALAVASAPERLAFTDAPADPHMGGRGGFKVSLGTIPDYAFSGKGVRLDGVRADAPAARAGLQRGDVIVKVGPHEVGNIHDYMFALGELTAGSEVVIEVERDGKRIPLKVVPAPGR